MDHATRRRRILQFHRVADLPQAETLHHRRLIAVEADRALQQRDFDRPAFHVRPLIRHLFMTLS